MDQAHIGEVPRPPCLRRPPRCIITAVSTNLTLAFGANQAVPDSAVAAWGARAIDHGHTVDLPHDRVSFGTHSEASATSSDAAKQRLLSRLTAADPVSTYCDLAAKIGITPDETITLAHDGGDGFTAVATRSGGYVYFAAWVI